MATKKEKRAKALVKRERFLKQVEADGLAALKADQERRKRELTEAQEKAEKTTKELLKRRGKPFARMARNGKTPMVSDETVNLLTHLVTPRKGGIDLKRELTVGEYLEAANKLLPVFSEK